MKKIISLSMVAALLLLMAACGGGSAPPPAEQPTSSLPQLEIQDTQSTTAPEAVQVQDVATDADKYGGVIKIIDTGDLNEPIGTPWDAIAGRTFHNCYAENLAIIVFGGFYEPGLAESWDIDMDKKTITFKLREGVRFTDGSPFNAEVIKWIFEAWAEDGKGNEDIKPENIRVIDEHTVEITYLNWQNVLFETFCMKNLGIISMENFLKNGKEYAKQNPVGTGPFKLKEFN
ncbi:MAG: ABC transporter substrate-binding protein, partial [Clostridiales bacterium]|nr:ABC transporter substrate-binding protein [Clostridiales bacterium]